jgi:hypothetical protein
MLDGSPALAYAVFASLASMAAALDIRMVMRGGIRGAQRIARHCWRMCLALLITAVSFFLGQAQMFPGRIQDSWILFMPEIVVLAALAFWMFRVLSWKSKGGVAWARDPAPDLRPPAAAVVQRGRAIAASTRIRR